ncbi:MAG: PKD domain-containing protein [Bacteroidetes bacterium]|nr:PKD domain-containing protein [Bacteroidota bacterium]MBS1941641.1 PKD domain-containing protein [Bacteroidota bacterium]
MKLIFIFLATIGSCSLANAQSTRVLFIGNSYTGVNDLPEMTRQLALSMGETLTVASSTPGGYTFQQHTTNATTQNLIDQGAWDFVVLQEQSQLPSFPPSQVASECLPYAQALVDTIRAHSPCAEPVFYMTWGRENGDAQNCASWPPVCTYEGMQQQLRQSYLQMAEDNSAACAPAGMAWKRVRTEFPAINLYSSDGSHPTVAGTYLVACTMYSTFFRTSTVGASFTSSLDAATALTLQQVASSVVMDSLETWNIGVNDPEALPEHQDQGNGSVFFSENSVNAMAHYWNLGDGSTSTESSFTHTYAANGTYTVTYVATDDCGRTDTSVFTVNMTAAGIGELDKPLVSVTSDAQGLVVINAGSAGNLVLFDLQGRRVSVHPIGATAKEQVPLPSGTAMVWRFQTAGGRVGSGLVVIP